jgi:hypothetical protein
VAPRFPILLSRRRLLAASGATLAAGGPAVLAACGSTEEDDEISPDEEAELLNAVLAQQLAVAEAAGEAATSAGGGIRQSVKLFARDRDRSAQALAVEVEDLGGTPTEEAVDLVGAESATEGLARQLETSIAASLAAIGELTPERRAPVHQAITEDAAVLAAIRSVLGEEIAPDAFVMGPPSSTEEAA